MTNKISKAEAMELLLTLHPGDVLVEDDGRRFGVEEVVLNLEGLFYRVTDDAGVVSERWCGPLGAAFMLGYATVERAPGHASCAGRKYRLVREACE